MSMTNLLRQAATGYRIRAFHEPGGVSAVCGVSAVWRAPGRVQRRPAASRPPRSGGMLNWFGTLVRAAAPASRVRAR